MFYFKRIPKIIQLLFPGVVWRIPKNKIVFLSFDDGPNPGSTPELLDLLRKFNIKATFFCLGQNVELYPELIRSILNEGHAVGIHGYEHLSGWKTPTNSYIKNVYKAAALIPSKLFRPPYGRMTYAQYRSLKKEYIIVNWTLMPGDFQEEPVNPDKIKSIVRKIRSGDIIVLHDSEKTIKYCNEFLEALIGKTNRSDFSFGLID